MQLFPIIGIILLAAAVWLGIRLYKTRQMQSADRSVINAILKNINAYLLLIDGNYDVIWTNFYTLTGSTPRSGHPKVGNLLRCKNGEDAGECGTHELCATCPVRAAIGESFRSKKNFTGLETPMTLYTSDDHTASVDCVVSVTGNLITPKNKERILLTIHDITELKRIQQELTEACIRAEESDRMKSQFLANVSHELRTPLNAILGFSELLATDTQAEDRQEYMKIIRTNCETLLQQMHDILDLSEIEAGALEFEYADEELNTIMEELEGTYRRKQEPDSPVKIEFRKQYDCCRIRTDRNRLAQVIGSFLSNALKFTSSKGGGKIVFGFEIRDKELYFYTTDTGIGIPEEKIGQLFKRFVKIGSYKQGLGLGLAISKSIVESMGGRIGVKSHEGQGSTFWFTLPLETMR